MIGNNLLIVGVTSGFMMASLRNFLKKKYKIFATYSNEKSLSNIPNNLKKSKNIKFIKLNLMEEDEKIINILKKNKVNADIIINSILITINNSSIFYCRIISLFFCLVINYIFFVTFPI